MLDEEPGGAYPQAPSNAFPACYRPSVDDNIFSRAHEFSFPNPIWARTSRSESICLPAIDISELTDAFSRLSINEDVGSLPVGFASDLVTGYPLITRLPSAPLPSFIPLTSSFRASLLTVSATRPLSFPFHSSTGPESSCCRISIRHCLEQNGDQGLTKDRTNRVTKSNSNSDANGAKCVAHPIQR